MAKIYLMFSPSGTQYVVMSPDGEELRQFSYLGAAELYALIEYDRYEVVQ